jgi:hypothetical protein
MTVETVELIAAYFTLAGDVYPFGRTQISPFPFRERVEAAARAGWKGMGFIPDDVETTAAKIGHGEMKRILAANNIKYVELEFLVDWHAEGERRKKSDELRERLLAIAEIFGARNIKVGPGLTWLIVPLIDQYPACFPAGQMASHNLCDGFCYSELNVRLRALTGSLLALDRRFIVSPIRSSTLHIVAGGARLGTTIYKGRYAGLTCRWPVIGGEASYAPHPWDRYGEKP